MTGNGAPRRRLIVFAKYPRAGEVKTRLVPPVTFEEAAGLSRAFLEDMLVAIAPLAPGIELEMRVARQRDLEPMAELVAGVLGGEHPVLVAAQRGAGLGERLASAVADAFAEGIAHVSIVGADHPTLPREYLRLAFDRLAAHDVVIGPADDGGYYLIGLGQSSPELFALESFSTPRLQAETLEAAREVGRTVALLPAWYDVDDAASLARLLRERHLLPPGSRTAAALDHLKPNGNESAPEPVRHGGTTDIIDA